MKDAAFARGHRREGEWLASGSNLLDSHLGHEVKFAIASGLEAFGIERDPVVLLGLEAEDLGGNVFDGQKKLAIAGQKKRRIGASELDSDLRILDSDLRIFDLRIFLGICMRRCGGLE